MLNFLITYLRSLVKKEEGQAMVEYGLIIALIAVGVIAALLILGPSIAGLFEGIGDRIGGVDIPEIP